MKEGKEKRWEKNERAKGREREDRKRWEGRERHEKEDIDKQETRELFGVKPPRNGGKEGKQRRKPLERECSIEISPLINPRVAAHNSRNWCWVGAAVWCGEFDDDMTIMTTTAMVTTMTKTTMPINDEGNDDASDDNNNDNDDEMMMMVHWRRWHG
jgi:hypothetical protein